MQAFAASLSFGALTRGEPLPYSLRTYFESLFGTDLSAIRLHVDSPLVASPFRALAHGTDVYFAGAYAPESQEGLWLLTHELAHLFQQCSLPASPSRRVQLLQDPTLETQADRIANLVLTHPDRAHHEFFPRFRHLRLTPDQVCWNWMQPNVHVIIDGKDIKLTNADKAMTMIQQGIKDGEIRQTFLWLKNRVRPVLEEWIKASRRLWKRWIKGQKERTVAYNSWDSLARALLGEVRSKSNHEIESNLAQQTIVSQYIKKTLADYLKWINSAMDLDRYSKVKKILFPFIGSYSREYKSWYPKGGFERIMKDPDTCEFKNLVAAIHDVGHAFEKGADGAFGNVPEDKCVASALVPNGVRGYDVIKAPMEEYDEENERWLLLFRVGSLGSKHCTLIEENEIIRSARDMGMPMMFGPSFTTGRVLQCCSLLCQRTGAGEDREKKFLAACAWGLFAFWNVYYERRFSRCHTFHETMDMANNYGVPYTPFWYPNHCPSEGDPFPVGQVPG